jgi:hypothetical protein
MKKEGKKDVIIELLYRNLCKGQKKSAESLIEDTRWPGRDSNRAPHLYKCRALPLDHRVRCIRHKINKAGRRERRIMECIVDERNICPLFTETAHEFWCKRRTQEYEVSSGNGLRSASTSSCGPDFSSAICICLYHWRRREKFEQREQVRQ